MTKPSSPDPTTILERVMRGPLERPPSRSGRAGMFLLVSVVGFLAGVVGGLVAISFILPFPSVFDAVTVRRSRSVPQTATQFPALAPIANAVVDLFVVEAKSDFPALLPLHARTGRGVALTSDGWVVTVRAALPKRAGVRPVIVTADRRMRSVDRIAFDPISDLTFLHVPDLEASVLALRSRIGIPIGTTVYAPTTEKGLAVSTLHAVAAQIPPGSLRSSERWASLLAFNASAEQPMGTPIVDGGGAMVGITMDVGRAIPVDAITSALPSLFADGVVRRNALGVTYRDASEFAFPPSALAEGVLLERDGRTPAVTPKSPLRGKLAEGDAIIAVGEDPLTSRRVLAELIQEYPLGTTVALRVRRAGKGTAGELTATLGTVSGETLIVAQPPIRSD